MDTAAEQLLREVIDRLSGLEEVIKQLREKQATKEHYTVGGFAAKVGKAPFTCREWARLGRIRATKRHSGRGAYQSWTISHEELLRYERFGLLPQPGARNGKSPDE
jgi:hypothetical protein